MQLGSVFIWKNFPYCKDGNIKNRYFLYIGESHFPVNPVHIFLITATTRKMHYEIGGSREEHNIYKFKAGSFGFVEDCILDIDFLQSNITKSAFNSCQNEIKEVGKLPEKELKEIYNLILKSKYINLKVKQDIYSSYNHTNITGLKRPKKNKK